MAGQSEYFIEVFKTLGAPLVRAALARAPADAPIDAKQVAQNVAELLTKSVQSGIDLGALVKLEQHAPNAETARMALTALGGNINAYIFERTGTLSDLTTMHAIVEALKTVMELAVNFNASPDAHLRLKTLDADGSDADILQSKIQTIHAFVPLIEAAQINSFGQAPVTFASDSAMRLIEKSQRLIHAHSALTSTNKAIERALLSALADIFTSVHKAHSAVPNATLEGLWQNFDMQLSIMDALVSKIIALDPAAPGAVSASPAPAAPVETAPPAAAPEPPPVTEPPSNQPPPVTEPPPNQPPPVETTPVQAPTADQAAAPATPQIFSAPIAKPVEDPASAAVEPPASPITPPPAAPVAPPIEPPVQAPPPAQSDTGAANPMGFFAKKPEQSQPPAAPVETPPPVAAPPTQIEAQPPAMPAQPPPAAEDPAVAQTGNPMAFFKKKPEDGTEDGTQEGGA